MTERTHVLKFNLAGEGKLQGGGGRVWGEWSFLKDDGEGEQQGGASAGQGGGRPDVEHLQVFVVFLQVLWRVWLDTFQWARFETAWNLGEDSPWCAGFVPEDLAVFEFREDLKYFYK